LPIAHGKFTLNQAYEYFGVGPEELLKVLSAALSRGGDYCDLFFEHHHSTMIRLQDNKVDTAVTNVRRGLGVRVVKGDQTGYSFTEDLSPTSMQGAARIAAGIASAGKTAPPQAFQPRTLANHYPVEYGWANVSLEQLVKILEQLNAETYARDQRIIKASAYLAAGERYIMIVDSRGQISVDYQPLVRIYLSCTAEENGRRETNGYDYSARDDLRFLSAERLQKLPEEAVQRTVKLFEAGPAPAGEFPVVLKTGSAGILLHEAIGHGMEADFNRLGLSIYADKMNQRVAEPFVTIVDNGTNPHVRGSINVDDEGNLSEETVLVENGILRSYMHDLISAKHYGVEPTGNGRRESFKHYPLPRMRNTYMLNGPHTFDEIIANVKYGILCEQFTNGQVNIGPGDFTFYVKSGYLIENGKLTRPIKDINIIGNGPQVLERITMVADDLTLSEGGWTCGKNGQAVPVSQGIPTVLVSSMTVGGTVV